jgi:methylmalonyl-CoA mutase
MGLKDRPDLSEFPAISFEEWKEKAEKELKGRPLEDLTWETEGFEIEPFFTREQVPGTEVPNPAQAPYRRGVLPSSNEWRIRVPFRPNDGTKIRKALDNGVQTIALYSEDDGRQKLPEESLEAESLELRAAKDPESWKSSFREKLDQLPQNGALLFDPVTHLLKEGEWPADGKENALQELVSISNELDREGFTWRSIPVNAAPFHNAGATLVEELAFTLSLGHEWLVHFLDNGWSIDALAPRMSFELSSGPLFFPEIAKFRAFRQLWSRVVEAYEPEHTCTRAPWIGANTSWWSLTRRDPYTNMVRKTTEAMAALIGGSQELTVHPYDAAGKENSELGERVARNTHHLLKEESQLNKVIDPLGGSYYLETLTDRIGESAWDLVREIEEQGGFFQALEKGSVQARIEASRQKRRESVENEERIIVGVNAYRDEEASILEQREEECKKPPKGKEITPLPQERISIEME